MVEVLINLKIDDPRSRSLARYGFLKLNLIKSSILEQVTEEIRVLQEELGHYLEDYEGIVGRLEMFVKVFSKNVIL